MQIGYLPTKEGARGFISHEDCIDIAKTKSQGVCVAKQREIDIYSQRTCKEIENAKA